MKKKYIVELTDSDRAFLKGCVDKGKNTAYQIKHAHILLKADAAGPAWTDTRIAEAFGCHAQTVYNVRRSFVERGLSGALSRATPRKPSRAPKLDGAAEARLIALSCGSRRWGSRNGRCGCLPRHSWLLSVLKAFVMKPCGGR